MIRSQLLRAIHLAQSEAMLRRDVTYVKKFLEEWQQGFVVRTQDENLYVFQPQKARGQLYWRAFPAHKDYLEFANSGMLQSENGTFWYCDAKKNIRWAVAVNKSGRAREILPKRYGQIETGHPVHC